MTKRKFTRIDVLRLPFRVAPASTLSYTLFTILHALMPTAFMALATANFVDTATVVLRGELPRENVYVPLAILILVLGVFTMIGYVNQLIRARIELRMQRFFKPEIVKTNAALNFKHIENAKSWELITRVSRDPVKSVMDGFGGYMQMLQIIVLVSSVLGLILSQVWWATLVILAFSVPLFVLSMKAGKKNYQAGRDSEKFNRRHEYLAEVLTGRDGVDERTVFRFGDDVNRRWGEQYEAGRKLRLKVQARTFVMVKSSSLIIALIALLIALTLLNPVMTGLMSAGMFIGILNAVFGMINQIGWQMTNALENISKVNEYMKDLTEFYALDLSEGAFDPPDAEPIAFESLEFKNVRFKYPSGETFILDGLSFKLSGGKHFAFVGRNGAGKTTITKLLTGLYTEYEGEILINGKELRTYSSSAVKAMFSVVYQDFAKYYVSLKDNIAVGNAARMDSANMDERINEASEMAGLADIVGELRDGLATPLGKILENGQDLSGGQWQRVAIARSVVSRAPVKILDEPTAALDPTAESRVYQEFEKLMAGKTTIFISHRLGSTKLADEILVIDGGRIVERGPHDVLMAQEGEYAEMFRAQREWYQ